MGTGRFLPLNTQNTQNESRKNLGATVWWLSAQTGREPGNCQNYRTETFIEVSCWSSAVTIIKNNFAIKFHNDLLYRCV